MSSSSTQEKIDKEKSIEVKRTRLVMGGGAGYAIIAHFLSGLPEISPILMPLTIGIGQDYL